MIIIYASNYSLFCLGIHLIIMIHKYFRLVFIAVFFINIGSTHADYEAGEAANRKGDRVTAFQEFKAAALNGENLAYGKLGSMYLYGLGTEKNYKQAYIWFHMSHLSGEKEGERFRNAASSMLSREAYSQAKKEAEEQRIQLGLGKPPSQ